MLTLWRYKQMNFKKIIALSLTAAMAAAAFTACTSNADDGDDSVVVINSQANQQPTAPEHIATVDEEGYVFEYNGVKVRVNTNANDVIPQLGDDYYYFEADSCAGVGKSKTYTYGNQSFVISTVPVGDFDLITNITLFDDTVTTPEGIYIGSTEADVTAAYGQPSQDVVDGHYIYELNDTMLVINTEDGVVSGISYNQISLN